MGEEYNFKLSDYNLDGYKTCLNKNKEMIHSYSTIGKDKESEMKIRRAFTLAELQFGDDDDE